MIDEPTGGGVPSEDTESESIEFVEPLPVGIRPHGDARFTPGVSLCSHGGGRVVVGAPQLTEAETSPILK